MEGDYKRDYASKGSVAGAYVTGGVVGGLALLNQMTGGNGLFGGCGNNYNTGGCCSENTPVTRYELDMALQLSECKSHNALLEANIFTDSKINDLGNRTLDRFGRVDAELREIAVYQGVNTAAISCLKGQVEQLQSLTKVVIPSTNVCQQDYPVVVTNTNCNPVITKAAV